MKTQKGFLNVAKVLDNSTAIDINGERISIPKHVAHKAMRAKSAIKLIETKTGGTQWRLVEMDVFEQLSKKAVPLAKVENHKNEAEDDIQTFLKTCVKLRPNELIIADLKWKHLMRSVMRGKNIMLTGPTGCGKTLSVQSVAKALNGRPFFYFNLGATQDPRSTLIGNTHYAKDKGTFVAEALFVKAIRTENAIILLDELTRAHADAWNILMTPLDENQRYLRIDEHPDTPTIKVAKGVTFISTANIGSEYTATRVLDRALLDRFPVVIEMEPLNVADETKLLTMTYPDVDPKLIAKVAEIACHTRDQVKSDDPRVQTMISSRVTVEIVGLIHDGFTLAEAAEMSIYPFFSNAGGAESERTYMRQLVQKYLPTESDTKGAAWANSAPNF
jgi:nitric oxide reductase NorQ protein